MPILPLNHPEPFAALLGVMLYPGPSSSEERKARAYAAHSLSESLRRFPEGGHPFTPEALGQLLMDAGGLLDAGESLDDIDSRCWAATATGEMVKALFVLSHTDPSLASWNNAARLAQEAAAREGLRYPRKKFWAAKEQFQSVAHLWGAWAIRGGLFGVDIAAGYDVLTDMQFFLAEAERLRVWGQNWRPLRAKAEPPFPSEMWRVPDDWRPPERRPGWPMTGAIPQLSLPLELLAGLRPAGRPRKAG